LAEQTRAVTIASNGATLEGVLQTPASAAGGILVVCHPHPLYGGSMHNNVVEALCDAALQEGVAALRFNFRGVGQSSGEHSGGEGEQDDVLAALAAAAAIPDATTDPRRIGLAGYSFGAAMAARAAGADEGAPAALVLISPPIAGLTGLLLDEAPAQDMPVLMMSGDLDHVCPPAELEALAKRLQSAQCIIVDGADHSWWGHESELRDTVGSFLRWNLAAG
jgi:alpha/beta superfamily hydrolase